MDRAETVLLVKSRYDLRTMSKVQQMRLSRQNGENPEEKKKRKRKKEKFSNAAPHPGHTRPITA